jgi:hypothetical protein
MKCRHCHSPLQHILLIGEMAKQYSYVREWGGVFVTAVPEMELLP